MALLQEIEGLGQERELHLVEVLLEIHLREEGVAVGKRLRTVTGQFVELAIV